MSISADAIKLLQQAQTHSIDANRAIEDLVAEHDYQDVAMLITQAASALLEAATLLMQLQDEAALDQLEAAEDLIDSVYEIIDADTD